MPTASSPYLMGQSSLNASHDVFMVRTMLFDPSSYWSEVHSFSGDLDHERTCRENLALRSTSERMGQSFDRGGSQRSTMLSAKVLPADPQRPERHHRLPTRESVHQGDTVPLHRVWWSQQPPVCGAASGGKHHSRWKVTCNIRVKCPEEGRTPKRKAGSDEGCC